MAETEDREAAPRSRRRWAIGLGALAVVIAAATFVLVVFQPQKLILDDEVNEAVPTVSVEPAAPDQSAAQVPSTTEPTALRTGSFVGLEHGTDGTAQILRVDDADFLRLEELDTSNGPDLYVYLTTNPATGPEDAFDDDFVDLGRLKGNVGNQNYQLPTGLDLERYTTVVIWCDRFDAAFGAADLT
jgi:hypothetical protein